MDAGDDVKKVNSGLSVLEGAAWVGFLQYAPLRMIGEGSG